MSGRRNNRGIGGFLLLSVMLLLLSGCAGDGLATPVFQYGSGTVERAAALKGALGEFRMRMVVLEPEEVAFYCENPQMLGDRLNEWGMNLAALKVDDLSLFKVEKETVIGSLKYLVDHLNGRGIAVWYYLEEHRFGEVNHRMQVIRHLTERKPIYQDFVQAYRLFAASLSHQEETPGIIVQLDCRMFGKGNRYRKHGSLYSWSEKNYGIGRDNDSLLKESLDEVAYVRRELPLDRLVLAVDPEIIRKGAEKALSHGSVPDLLTQCDQLLLYGSGNSPEAQIKLMDGIIQNSLTPRSLLLGIPLAQHPSERQTRLRKRDWATLCADLGVISQSLARRPSLDGVALFSMEQLETLFIQVKE